jgi:hypothetical protein
MLLSIGQRDSRTWQRAKEEAARRGGVDIIVQETPGPSVAEGLGKDPATGAAVWYVDKDKLSGNLEEHKELRRKAAEHGASLKYFTSE